MGQIKGKEETGVGWANMEKRGRKRESDDERSGSKMRKSNEVGKRDIRKVMVRKKRD